MEYPPKTSSVQKPISGIIHNTSLGLCSNAKVMIVAAIPSRNEMINAGLRPTLAVTTVNV